MKNPLAWFAVLITLALSACGGSPSVPDVPAGVSVAPGDGRAVITFTQQPGLEYWVFYAPGDTVSFPGSMQVSGYRSVRLATSPLAVTGLTNDTQYAFIVAASSNGSKAGPTSAPLTTTPRAAGDTWVAGASTGAATLNAVVFDGTRFVAVGDAGTIVVSTDLVTWTPAVSGTTARLLAITYAGGRYVAVGEGGTVLVSVDRVTWSAAGSGT